MEIIQFYPFLNSIHSFVKPKIDWEELWIPNSYEILLIDELAQRLNTHVVLYKKDYRPKSTIQLSTTLISTKLNSWQTAIIKNYEEKFSDYCKIKTYNTPIKLAESIFPQLQRETAI